MTLFDLLLALYPRRVRERFGDGMRAAFAADYADARGRGRRAAVAFVLSTVVQTFGAAAAERLPRPAAVRSFFTTDVRDAIRSLAGTPLVTGVAVLSLTLGIGANTALYSILYSLVSKPLPVAARSGWRSWPAMTGPIPSGRRSAVVPTCSTARSPGPVSASISPRRGQSIRWTAAT
jgi:hypothetical protein